MGTPSCQLPSSICIFTPFSFPSATAGLFLGSHIHLGVSASALDQLQVETFHGSSKKCFHVIMSAVIRLFKVDHGDILWANV